MGEGLREWLEGRLGGTSLTVESIVYENTYKNVSLIVLIANGCMCSCVQICMLCENF